MPSKTKRVSPRWKLPGLMALAGLGLLGAVSYLPSRLWAVRFSFLWKRAIFHSQVFMAEKKIPASKIVVVKDCYQAPSVQVVDLLMEDQEWAKEIYLCHQMCDQWFSTAHYIFCNDYYIFGLIHSIVLHSDAHYQGNCKITKNLQALSTPAKGCTVSNTEIPFSIITLQ